MHLPSQRIHQNPVADDFDLMQLSKKMNKRAVIVVY